MAEWGIEGWILERRLGAGALGEVWQAIRREGEWQERAALKFLSPGDTVHVDDDLERRFALEARIGKRLHHPHVRRVMGHGHTTDAVPYIVMELLDGTTLESWLEAQGQLPLGTVHTILRQVGAALDAAHAMGVVHRDVKPSNIFVLEDPLRFKLFDFGSAKFHGEQLRPGERRTDPDVVIGSPAYLSPEAINEPSRTDHRVDLWALSVTAFKCLTGQLPFNGKGLVDTCGAILEGRMRGAKRLRADLPEDADAWFANLFARDVAQRPATGVELAESFRQLCGLSNPAPTKTRPLPRAALAAAAAAIVVVTGVGLAASQRPNAPAPSTRPQPEPAPMSPLEALPGTTAETPRDEPDGPSEPAALATAPPSVPSSPASAPDPDPAAPAGASPVRVVVEAGDVELGCRGADCKATEGAPRRVFVPAFAIDPYEVTVADYDACVRAGACTKDELDRFTGKKRTLVPSSYCNWDHDERRTHPVNCVSGAQARTYCAWADGRLPTPLEWEKAARGDDGRRFPWGNERASCAYAVMHEGQPGCRAETTAPVGTKPKDRSPWGVYDMAGNVGEWVADDGAPEGHLQVRGGGWGMNDSPTMRPTRWHWAALDSRSVHVGFRCVSR